MDPQQYSWVRYIQNRTLKKNKNFLGTITGPTGSGKSWAGLSIGEMVDPDFNVDRIIFTGRELMDLINSGKLKSGSFILWDEAGIDLSSRNWQSLTNKMLNFVLQTFRHKNLILIFTTPYHDFLDVASRKLFHAEFETSSINKTKKTCRIKPKLLQYNADLKKWYKKYLKIVKGGVGKSTIRRWDVPKPSDELIRMYEEKKNKFTAVLNKDIESKLEKLKEKEETKPEVSVEFTKVPSELQMKILSLVKQGIYTPRELAIKLNRDDSTISYSMRSFRKIGFKLEDYRDNKGNVLGKGGFGEVLAPLAPPAT